MFPFSFISYLLRLVNQPAVALHMPPNPLSFVLAAILIIEHPKSILQSINLIPLIFASLRIGLLYVLSSLYANRLPILKAGRVYISRCFNVLNRWSLRRKLLVLDDYRCILVDLSEGFVKIVRKDVAKRAS